MTLRRCVVLIAVMLCSAAAVAQTHLVISAPDNASVGFPFDVIVSAVDPSGATVTSYSGTVHFSSSAPAVLPPNYTFVPADAGRHTFSVKLNSDGVQTITVTDTVTTASASVNLTCSTQSGTVPIAVGSLVCARSTGNVATMAAGLGTYFWHISDGTITSGQGTRSITFTPGPSSIISFIVTTTQANGCPGPDGIGSIPVRQLPTASVPATIRTCPTSKLAIPVTLTGTPPFSITWSDGVVQSNVSSFTVTRNLQVAPGPTLKITGVTDAACASTDVVTVKIVFDGLPIFGLEPADVTIRSGESATLKTAATPATRYEWYQGVAGDETNKVGTGDTFQTPALVATTKYWVKAMSDCASTQSRQVTVTVTPVAPTAPARRRAVGRGK